MTANVLGIQPTTPGFVTFNVIPFLDPSPPNSLTRVRGVQPITANRTISAAFSCNGTGFLSVPTSTVASMAAVPLCGPCAMLLRPAPNWPQSCMHRLPSDLVVECFRFLTFKFF
jgi:hypothetical protein